MRDSWNQYEWFGGFRVGVQSYTYRELPLEKAFAELKSLGLNAFEIYPGHHAGFNENADPAAMKAMLSDAGIVCPAYGVVSFDADAERAERLFRFAQAMGIELLSADPAPESFPILDRLVRQYDIRIGIHNHGPKARYDTIDDVWQAVQPWDARIGACVDTGHFLRSDEDPARAIRTLGNRVHGIHLKDFTKEEKDSVVGTARLNVLSVLQALREVGFSGPFMLEYEADPENPTPALSRSVAVVRAMVNAMA